VTVTTATVARPARGKLTARQAEVFEAIVRLTAEFGRGPTLRELGSEFGMASPNGVRCHLLALEKKKHITLRDCKARGIVVPELHEALRVAAKILLGKVKAGGQPLAGGG